MPNPFLPLNEYIPDGEPRVFGNRVYIYGSHDRAGAFDFCDYQLKVWSAPIDNLNNWQCHGNIFATRENENGISNTDWTNNKLFAPDVVEKGGEYYLYAYIVGAKGCVAKSAKPEGPFKLLSQYKYDMADDLEGFDSGIFTDPGVFVDDDNRTYIYCGYLHSYMAEVNSDNMFEIIKGSFKKDIIPKEEPYNFFEGCSMRKVGDTYYLIYSPTQGSRLVYATSKSPMGPFDYRGIIIDNGIDYTGGNDHGSICNINGQWYIFYHRMTNNSCFSRRACVEKIEILEDGTIPQVEMTSLGFEEYLSPYYEVKADIACVLKNGAFVTEYNDFTRVITNIKKDSIIGYKYFDFGDDNSSKVMDLIIKVRGKGIKSDVKVLIDDYKNGEEIGTFTVGLNDDIIRTSVKNITGRHSLFFIVDYNMDNVCDWATRMFENRELFELEAFVFEK